MTIYLFKTNLAYPVDGTESLVGKNIFVFFKYF